MWQGADHFATMVQDGELHGSQPQAPQAPPALTTNNPIKDGYAVCGCCLCSRWNVCEGSKRPMPKGSLISTLIYPQHDHHIPQHKRRCVFISLRGTSAKQHSQMLHKALYGDMHDLIGCNSQSESAGSASAYHGPCVLHRQQSDVASTVCLCIAVCVAHGLQS